MQLVFLYGQPACGKLTVARALAARTGFSLFHNHLVVDAVAAVFPFGSAPFVALRERFWLDVFAEAARTDRSLIFTFAPEPSVAADFPERVQALVRSLGGTVVFVALTVPEAVQERRLVDPGRAVFGKLMSLDLLRTLRSDFAACMAAMPAPAVAIDTAAADPEAAADEIFRRLAR